MTRRLTPEDLFANEMHTVALVISKVSQVKIEKSSRTLLDSPPFFNIIMILAAFIGHHIGDD